MKVRHRCHKVNGGGQTGNRRCRSHIVGGDGAARRRLVPDGIGEDRFAYPGRRRGPGPPRHRSRRSRSTHALSRTREFARRSWRRPGSSPTPSASAGRSCSPGCCPTTSRRRAASAAAPWWRQVRGRRPGAGPRARSRVSTGAATTRSCTSAGTTPQAYCAWAGHAAADRGGVGVRGARRARGAGVPLGRRARAGRRAPHERLAGRRSRARTPSPTATTAPAPSTRSRRTATACTT